MPIQRKNTLPKNYLYFAEKNGTEIISEAEVVDIKPLADNPGYGVEFKSSTRFLNGHRQRVQAKRRDLIGKRDGHDQVAIKFPRC